jgi:hypothetical protein
MSSYPLHRRDHLIGAAPVVHETEKATYAQRIADESFDWYRTAAIRARRLYRTSEISTIIISGLVPLSAVVLPANTIVPALLGSAVVMITGLRSVFHWNENYLRFSRAREAVEAERRSYHTNAAPYELSADRDALLVQAISEIEQNEMGQWLKVAAQPTRQPGT